MKTLADYQCERCDPQSGHMLELCRISKTEQFLNDIAQQVSDLQEVTKDSHKMYPHGLSLPPCSCKVCQITE